MSLGAFPMSIGAFPMLLAALLMLVAASLPVAASAAVRPWLVISDIHFDPVGPNWFASELGTDTNPKLFDSALAQMRRVDPDPPVVIIDGDFFAHRFDAWRAVPTMRFLAKRFDRAFPHAQFVIALGNEDSACGDYALAPNSPFLREAARAWEPLVNRRGAAPDFSKTFVRDGFYTATLPVAHTRIVVLDDVFWSPRYRAACGVGGAAAAPLSELHRALDPHGSERRWVMLHIPPGIDAYSTANLTHHLIVVPFLDPDPAHAFVSAVADPGARVDVVLASHTHKFAYRLIERPGRDPIPMLLIPSLSPVFRNAPGFVTMRVDPHGTIATLDDHAFVERRWRDVGGSHTLGLRAITGKTLANLQDRLYHDSDLREIYANLYESGAPPESDERNWRTYWCAAQELRATDFRGCVGEPGTGIVTRRGVYALAAAVLVALALAVLLARTLLQRSNRSRRRRSVPPP